MSETIIQIQHLSKGYRLGTIGTGSFRQDLQRWWTASVRGQDNAFFGGSTRSGAPSYINALDDVSFDIRRGEVWGVVGSNGAGKSTLLKIISRIIRPSEGVIRGKGTISSLLEVGTGFHPELTGRENIYISGYMLGMKKADIQRQFDEIVAFSGIESFIDTPIKRYSSGMYMRLAFAVAAHLDPDILIVDEVLAVGDADFQKKCLGKMQEVSHDKGRTILFVSHNMQAVSHLCQKAVWLQQGRVQAIGDTQAVVSTYAGTFQQNRLQQSWATPDSAPGNDCVRIKSVGIVPEREPGQAGIDVRTPLRVCFTVWNLVDSVRLRASLQLMSPTGECIFQVLSPDRLCPAGLLEGECLIPGDLLNDGVHYLSLTLLKDNATVLFQYPECLSFRVDDYRERTQGFGKWPGAVRPALPFTWQPALVGPLHP